MRGLDIGVAGCGIGGLAAALLLARGGHRVSLYERFEAPRAVGSGLMVQPTGLAVLDRLGLASELVGAAAPVERLFGKAEPSGRVVLDVRYEWLRRPGARGYGVHRATLFEILHRAVTALGIPVHTGRTVTALAGRRLHFAGGDASPPHDLVVDALGSASQLAGEPARPLAYGALWASLDWVDGLDSAALEQRYREASIMAGVLPIGLAPRGRRQAAFFWSLRGDRLAAWREQGLDAWKSEVRALWPATAPLLDQIASADRLTFARYAHRTLSQAASQGLIHIGDSWHSASPQLGQGANMALLDAWALARALGEEDSLDAALRRAVGLRRSHVRLYQALSTLFTPAYQSDGRVMPWIRDRIVPPFGRLWPATRMQAEMVAGTFGGPLGRLGLVPPGAD
jgi:2-polyprenyl-6-methoxyphenol hydroxylase-like FAD-dependent oxidoreductase